MGEGGEGLGREGRLRSASALRRQELAASRVSEWGALLNGSQNGSADWLGKFNWCKKALRIKVVFPRLVDDSNLPVLFRFRVGKHLIDLPTFQGNLVAFVLQAHNELFGG